MCNKKNGVSTLRLTLRQIVGMTRFELAASSSRTKRATGLRYIPKQFRRQRYEKIK